MFCFIQFISFGQILLQFSFVFISNSHIFDQFHYRIEPGFDPICTINNNSIMCLYCLVFLRERMQVLVIVLGVKLSP